jgi:hypothetical protein
VACLGSREVSAGRRRKFELLKRGVQYFHRTDVVTCFLHVSRFFFSKQSTSPQSEKKKSPTCGLSVY